EDEAASQAVRLSARGRKVGIFELRNTLGGMSGEERREQGPRINGLKERVAAAIVARRQVLKERALDERLNTETIDVTLPMREPPAEIGRVHPLTQVNDEPLAIFPHLGFPG